MKRVFCTKLKPAPKNTYLYRVQELSDYVDMYFDESVGPKEKKVMLIRHAWSVGNDRHLLYGHTDYDLTQLGVQQAMYLQTVMTKERSRFTSIYSSKLKRTYATGGISLSLGDSPSEKEIIRDERFNEFDFGELEGVHWGKMDPLEVEVVFRS